ncbi:hypothetical protein OG21DRAFT_1482888 [Imleria badia]|nr:hypothetical protein OG21DRAFT_1482888 [Imleria badia]
MPIELTPAARSLLQTISEAEVLLQKLDAWLSEMSKLDRSMQTVLAKCTVPRDRYEKRVGKANAFFTPMEWDDIIRFAHTHQQDCIDHKWNYFCMLEHLSAKFPKKMSVFQLVISNLWTRLTWLKNGLKERPIADSDAGKFKALMEKQTVDFTKIVMDAQKQMSAQWDKAVELLQQLDKADMGHPNCCANAHKASALAYLDLW